MRLLVPTEMPGLVQGTVYRQSPLVTTLGGLVMAAMLLGLPAFFLWQAAPPVWLTLVMGCVGCLILRGLIRHVGKAWRRSNWMLRIAPDGLWINLRSYLNHALPPGRTVLYLPYEEIACVRAHTAKRAEKTGNDVAKWTDRCLEIELAHQVPAEVRTELSEERRRYVVRTRFGGLMTSRSRYGHAPVTLRGDRVIRLAWRGQFDWITPSTKHALAELQRWVTIAETTSADLSDLQSLTPDQVDQLVLELVECSNKIGAVKLLTDRRGFNLTEAHRFVDELAATV